MDEAGGGWRRGGGCSSSFSRPCLTPVEFDEQGRDVSAEKTVMNRASFKDFDHVLLQILNKKC